MAWKQPGVKGFVLQAPETPLGTEGPDPDPEDEDGGGAGGGQFCAIVTIPPPGQSPPAI